MHYDGYSNLTTKGVSMYTFVNDKIHRCSYINSPKGRQSLLEDVNEPFLSEILEVFGDNTTVSDYTDECNIDKSTYLDHKYSIPMDESLIILTEIILPSIKDDVDKVIKLSSLIRTYLPGNHIKGEVYRCYGQVWECIQDFDTNTYPDIYPLSDAWFTFNKPYHDTSAETARPWLKPKHGTTDMYLKDEYMIYTDENVYRCLRDTNYSPEEYSADWEKVS